ncbi:MAG: extracellular solute-binding protein [Anaerolineae bacterium]
MSNRKNITWLLLAALLLALVITACGGGQQQLEQAVEEAAQAEQEAAAAADAAATEEAAAAAAAADAAATEEAVAAEEAAAAEAAAAEEASAEEAAASATAEAEAAAADAAATAEAEAAAAAEPDYDTDIYGNIDEIDLSGAEVLFWHQHRGGRGEQLDEIIADFNATNEWGIVVTGSNEGGYGDIYDKMIAGLTTGELPGLVVAYQNQAAAYEVADGLISLDPYINHPVYGLSEEDRADFFSAFLNADRLPQFGGAAFGFPPNRSMEVLYYNADWLAELFDAGAISFEGPPQTPDQFAEAVCAAAENPFSKNQDPSFSVGYEVRTDASSVAALTFARGGDIYDYENNQFTYNTPETLDGLTQMADLLAQGCAGEIAERFADQTDFGNGKTLFTMGSSSGLPFYKSAVDGGEAGGFNWSVAPIPYTAETPVQNIYGASVSIPKTDPQTQLAAWLFLKYYTSPEIQARWAKASNYFPVRESVAEGLSDYFNENPAYQTAFDLLQYGKTEAPVAGYDLVRDEARAAFNRILTGEDAATVLAELDAAANAILAEAAP